MFSTIIKVLLITVPGFAVTPTANAGALKKYLDRKWGHLLNEDRMRERYRNMMKRSYQWPSTDRRYGNPPGASVFRYTTVYPTPGVETPWRDFRPDLYNQRLIEVQRWRYHRNRMMRRCYHPYRMNCQ